MMNCVRPPWTIFRSFSGWPGWLFLDHLQGFSGLTMLTEKDRTKNALCTAAGDLRSGFGSLAGFVEISNSSDSVRLHPRSMVCHRLWTVRLYSCQCMASQLACQAGLTHPRWFALCIQDGLVQLFTRSWDHPTCRSCTPCTPALEPEAARFTRATCRPLENPGRSVDGHAMATDSEDHVHQFKFIHFLPLFQTGGGASTSHDDFRE